VPVDDHVDDQAIDAMIEDALFQLLGNLIG